MRGRVVTLQRLLAGNADPSVRVPRGGAAAGEGRDALAVAVMRRHDNPKKARLVAMLLAAKADASGRNPVDSSTPLLLATYVGSAMCVELLLQHSADINAQVSESHSACVYMHAPCASPS